MHTLTSALGRGTLFLLAISVFCAISFISKKKEMDVHYSLGSG